MQATYNPDDDLLLMRFSDEPTTREHTSDDDTVIGFDAEGNITYLLASDVKSRGILPLQYRTGWSESHTLPANLNRSDNEIAADMGITVEKLYKIREASPHLFPPFEELGVNPSNKQPGKVGQ